MQCLEAAFLLSLLLYNSGVTSVLPEYSEGQKNILLHLGVCQRGITCNSRDHATIIVGGILSVTCHRRQSRWLSTQELPQHGSRVQSSKLSDSPHF